MEWNDALKKRQSKSGKQKMWKQQTTRSKIQYKLLWCCVFKTNAACQLFCVSFLCSALGMSVEASGLTNSLTSGVGEMWPLSPVVQMIWSSVLAAIQTRNWSLITLLCLHHILHSPSRGLPKIITDIFWQIVSIRIHIHIRAIPNPNPQQQLTKMIIS